MFSIPRLLCSPSDGGAWNTATPFIGSRGRNPYSSARGESLSVEHYVPYLARGTQARPAAAAIEDAVVPSGSASSGDAAPESALALDDAVADVVVQDPAVRDLKAEVVTRERLMTHMPKN